MLSAAQELQERKKIKKKGRKQKKKKAEGEAEAEPEPDAEAGRAEASEPEAAEQGESSDDAALQQPVSAQASAEDVGLDTKPMAVAPEVPEGMPESDAAGECCIL